MVSPESGYLIRDSDKEEVGKRLKPIKKAESWKGGCLFIIDETGKMCGEPAVDCHVLTEATVLKPLADCGAVLELYWDVNRWIHHLKASSKKNSIKFDPDEFEPRSVGTGSACVRWYACNRHDNEFSPIDAWDPNFDDTIVQFSYMYRMSLYAADLCRMLEKLINQENSNLLKTPNRNGRLAWIKGRNFLKRQIPIARHTAMHLGQLWYNYNTSGEFNLNMDLGQTLFFRSQVKFAACALYGENTVAVVLPFRNDWQKMGVFHLTERSDVVHKGTEQLIRTANASHDLAEHGLDVLEALMGNLFIVAAVSPDSYRDLSEEDKHRIKRLIANASGLDGILQTLLA